MTKTVVRVEKEMQKKITRFDLVLSASDHIFQRMVFRNSYLRRLDIQTFIKLRVNFLVTLGF